MRKNIIIFLPIKLNLIKTVLLSTHNACEKWVIALTNAKFQIVFITHLAITCYLITDFQKKEKMLYLSLSILMWDISLHKGTQGHR